jgi:hypothetical protein
VAFFAAFYGHTEILRALLDAGCAPGGKTSIGMSLLFAAASMGMVDAAQLLVERGAQVSERLSCVYRGMINFTPLIAAAMDRHVDMVEFLVEKKADMEMKAKLLPSKISMTAIESAALTSATDCIRALLAAKAEPRYIPIWGAMSDSVPTLQVCLDAGVSLNCTFDLPWWRIFGFTPMHIAAMLDKPNYVDFLVAHDADRSAKLTWTCVGYDALAFAQVQKKKMAKLGLKTHDAVIEALQRPPVEKRKEIQALAVPENVSALRALLQQYGIDTAAYGSQHAKTVAHLHKELREGESRLALSHGTLLRVVEPVFVSVYAVENGVIKYVVEKDQVYADGRMRSRRMLLAEKKKPAEGWADCALRGVQEELSTTQGLRVSAQSYFAFEEEKRSLSYPGLLSRYVSHSVAIELTAPSADLGMPGFRDFETEEPGLVHRWVWWTQDACATLVGFAQGSA